VSHLVIYSFCTGRNGKLLVLKQKIRFLIYFEFSFNQLSHSKAIVVLLGKVKNFPTVTRQGEKVCGKLECRHM